MRNSSKQNGTNKSYSNGNGNGNNNNDNTVINNRNNNNNDDLYIPRNHKDISFYVMSAMFKDEIIDYYDLKLAKIKDIIQTKVPYVEVKGQYIDISFILEDNTIAHFEFESDYINRNDLIRYGHYDLELHKAHPTTIRRIVIFAAGVQSAPAPLRIGSVNQKHKYIFLKKDFDGDRVLAELREIVLAGKPITVKDKIDIMLLPMMKSTQSDPSKRAWEAVELLQQYKDKKTAHYLIGMIMAVNYNSLTQKEKDKILEVLIMSEAFHDLAREFEKRGEKRIITVIRLLKKGVPAREVARLTGLCLDL